MVAKTVHRIVDVSMVLAYHSPRQRHTMTAYQVLKATPRHMVAVYEIHTSIHIKMPAEQDFSNQYLQACQAINTCCNNPPSLSHLT